MMTLNVSITNSPPTIRNTTSFLVSTASMPIAPPSPSAPTSPMNTDAGYALYQRKPTPAPNSAAAKIASSAAPSMCATWRYIAIDSLWPPAPISWVSTPAMYAKIMNVAAFMIVGPIASPSSQSVRMTALAAPPTSTAPNTQYSQPGSVNALAEQLLHGSWSCS